MPDPDIWAEFSPAHPSAGGGIVPLPPKPGEPKTTFHTLSPKEAVGQGLPPGVYQESSEGKVDKVGDLPKIDTDLANSIKGLGLDEWLTNATRAREQIKTGFATGVLGSLAGHFPGTPRKDFLGSLEGIKGASILEKLQALRDQSKNGSSGMGSLTEQEGERLANSIASLSPDMSATELNKSLDIVERHARSLQAIGAGEDPNDPTVQKRYDIKPLPGAVVPPAAPKDKGITASNALPVIDVGQQTELSGTEKSVTDPVMARIKPQLEKYLNSPKSKVSDAMILGFLKKNGIDPATRTDILQALPQRGKATFIVNPTYNVPLSDAGAIPGTSFLSERDMARAGTTAGGAAAMNAANAVSAGNLGNLVGDPEGVDRALTESQKVGGGYPALAGNIGGGVTAGIGLEGLLAKLGMAPGIVRGAVADTTYGGGAGAGSNSDMGTAGRIANGALYGLGGSLAGQGFMRVPGAAFRGATSPGATYVAREVPGAMTIGQAVGGRLKGLEDRLSGLPIVGDTVNARRLEGLQKMNSRTFDRALEPIKENVAGQFGEQAIADAQDKVSQAFTKALAGKVAQLDTPFIVAGAKAKLEIDKLPDSVAGDVENLVDGVMNNYFDDTGKLTGENLQAALREFGDIKRSYQGTPLGHRIGKVVDQFSDSIEGMFHRQAPEVMPQYDAAKKAYRRVSILQDAVIKASATGGVFTPAQLGLAQRANTIKFSGKGAAAAGKGEFHEFQRNVQDVLPNKVPDSGTAGRLILPAVVAGAVTGGGAGAATGAPAEGAAGGAGTGLTLAALLTMAYSKTGQRAFMASALRRGTAAKTVGRALQRVAPVSGHGVAASTALGGSRE